MNALNPVCKLFGILLPTLILAVMHDPVLNLAVFIICMLLLLLSRISLRKLCCLLLPILIISAGMFFTGYHFHVRSGAPVNADILSITDSAVWNGLTFSSRVLVYAGLGLLFVLTTNKIYLVQAFRQQLRLSPLFAYGLLAAWNIFPNIAEEYRKTRAAFRARGLNPCAVSPALLKPMLIKAVLWSEALSVAMESKGFNGRISRTEYEELKLTAADILFPAVTTGGLLAAALLFFS